ncbi:hypothetical protein CTheo_2847 [Ceratobasidium theobromae]|uniref:T6SS Phospholipase effector Tle1-like catalytic domain-containing protein n=1 Tax=Ceratobasidium theobromae TaxID=1582974 RepID=A0A5N5QPP2_9AGAM|nr:hypothetical protein CTheo_2847 [Ceratobasidium theobromae]
MTSRLPTIDTRPPGGKPRTLVLCFDGTTNVYDDTNTNVVKLFSLLKRDNRDEQMVYYQPGVGTYAPPGIFLPISLALAKIADQGVALYLDKHVMGGYEFLMKHYNSGDRICLFGFSRGAYTARALAGMLNKVGLLPPDNLEQIPFAYSMYKRGGSDGFKDSAGFKKTFSRSVEIEFLGVWDTVSSVGLLWPRHLPFTSSNNIVKTFRHAVSLDEHRAKFKQNVWHVHSANAADALRDPESGSPLGTRAKPISSARTRDSPSATLPLPAKSRKPELNVTIMDATPPTENATLNTTLASQVPLLHGKIQTDLRNFVTSPGPETHEKKDAPWHPHETTLHNERPDSGIEGVGINIDSMPTPVTTPINHELQAIRSEISIASGITSGVGVAASIGVAGELGESGNKPSTGIMGWLRSQKAKPKKTSTQLSGGVKFEEAWEERHSDSGIEQETDVLEVWFAGCHSDVGGGAEKNDAKHSLSDISLRWMVRQIITSQCGIQFDGNALKEMHIPPPTLSFKTNISAHYSSPADAAIIKEAHDREAKDALADMHDALRNPLWWPLEFFPLVHSYQDETGKWHRNFRWNLFGPRHARKTLGAVKVHRSVQYRMEKTKDSNHPYKHRAIIDGNIEWVD